jgi:hypothetical protein
MKQTAVEWYCEKSVSLSEDLRTGKIDFLEWFKEQADILKQAKAMEVKQRQADTNHGYAQGYDDAAQGKEPMQPETL